MSELSKALQALIDNPDDLSSLPQLVAKAQELEEKLAEFPKVEEQYQERINKLQEINRSYLAQIPIPGNEPTNDKDDQDKAPTFKEAQQELLKAMQNVGGNENG